MFSQGNYPQKRQLWRNRLLSLAQGIPWKHVIFAPICQHYFALFFSLIPWRVIYPQVGGTIESGGLSKLVACCYGTAVATIHTPHAKAAKRHRPWVDTDVYIILHDDSYIVIYSRQFQRSMYRGPSTIRHDIIPYIAVYRMLSVPTHNPDDFSSVPIMSRPHCHLRWRTLSYVALI